MKLRIIEKNAGTRFIIQHKRKYWFWINARNYAQSTKYSIGKYKTSSFHYYYDNYKSAKDDLDRLIQYKLEAEKRTKAKVIVRDEIDLDDERDKFLAAL